MRKLLALTLSLLMVFSVMPMTFVLAEGETYLSVFDASSETASSQIGSKQSGSAAIATYAVPTGETDTDGNPVTEDRTVLKYTRTSDWNGAGVGIKADYRSVIKGAIGIRFWLAGDPTLFNSTDSVSLGFQTSSMGYKTATEHSGNWLPTAEGATYEWYWNTTNNVWKIGATTIDSAYNIAGKANALFTDSFLGQVKQIMFGVDAYSAGSLKEVYYIDDVELIYPAGVTPAPIEFVASFVGTETATLAADVEDIKSDAANNDAVVMPEATLVEGELEGWAFNGDITKVYAPGETAYITNNATFYAVRKDRPALATPAAPVAQVVNGASVTLTKVDGAVYSKDGATWQTSNVFTSLTPGSTYTFYQKMAETLTHAESAVSEGLTVTTPLEYVYEAENCTPKGYKAGTTTAHTPGNYETTDGGVKYKYVQDNNTTGVGAKNVFTVANLPTGIFTLTTYARNVANSRSSYEVTILNADGEVVGNFGTVNFADLTYKFDGATYHSANYLENEVTIEEEGTYTLVFTNVKAGATGICLDSFSFKKVADYNATEAIVKIDGEEVAVLDIGATYTIPTPPTGYYYSDGNNDYYGGEQVVLERNLSLLSEVLTAKEVYTMDEGKQMVSASTANIGYGQEGATYEDVDGDMKLALKVKSDQRSAFQLPADWSSKPYYKPVKITFDLSKNVSTSVAYKNMAFSSSTGSHNATAGDVYTIFNSVTYVPMTVSIDVTEDMYGYKYITGQYYAETSWSESAPVYAYVDNVTIYYEYDFDYVPPTECKVTIDGEEVATVLSGATYTLPALEAGKYYVGYEDVSEVVITGDLELTTAFYTYTITVDGQVVATVDYGTEYTLPALEAGKYYVDVTDTTFVVTENKEFTTATYTYDITIDGNVVATVDYGTEYTLPTLPVSKYYVGVTEKTFTVTSDLTFTTANKDAVDSLIVYDADANGKTGAIGMWGTGAVVTYADRKGLTFGQGSSYTGAGVTDGNMFGSFADYADTAIGVRFWVAANSDETVNNIKVYIGSQTNYSDNYKAQTFAGETVTVPGTTWTQYTVMFNENVTAEKFATIKYIMFTVDGKGIKYYLDDVELLVSEDVDSSCDITIDGTVVDTVEYNSVYTLPTPEAGKYYVGDPETTFTVTEDVEFTTAFYTYDITIDGQVVATVDYGTEYTLPQLEAGKYYVGDPETTFVVTEDVEFTTATYEYDITIDGVKVATVAYGDTFVLPAAPDGKQYVDGYVDGQEFVVTSELAFFTEDIPEQDGLTTSYISTQEGASIRLNEVNGMRFYATVDAGLDLTTVDEMGIIIAPNDIVGDYFTTEDDHIKVVYDHKTHKLWSGNQIVGSIVKVADHNLARDFIARAYVVIDGVTYYAETATVRNLAYVADAYIADTNAETPFDALDADTKALVEKWAAAND